MAEMEEANMGIDQGGGRCPDLGPDILSVSAIDPAVRIRDVGDNTAHREGVGRITPQGGQQTYR